MTAASSSSFILWDGVFYVSHAGPWIHSSLALTSWTTAVVKYITLGQAFNINFDVVMDTFKLMQKHLTFQHGFVSTSSILGSGLNFWQKCGRKVIISKLGTFNAAFHQFEMLSWDHKRGHKGTTGKNQRVLYIMREVFWGSAFWPG